VSGMKRIFYFQEWVYWTIEKETMFRDDFDEFRARSYSGGFLSFAVDGKRSTSDPTRYYFESTATDSETTGNDITVTEIDVLPGRVRERRHSDEMQRDQLKVETTRISSAVCTEFSLKFISSWPWPFKVTWRHRSRVVSYRRALDENPLYWTAFARYTAWNISG